MGCAICLRNSVIHVLLACVSCLPHACGASLGPSYFVELTKQRSFWCWYQCTRRTAEILHRITHHINRDKLVPSFQYAVTRRFVTTAAIPPSGCHNWFVSTRYLTARVPLTLHKCVLLRSKTRGFLLFASCWNQSGLRALHKLQASKTVPFQREFFHNHALYGKHRDISCLLSSLSDPSPVDKCEWVHA